MYLLAEQVADERGGQADRALGQRIVELQEHLARRVRELEDALSRVKQLQGLLPICSFCKKIRNEEQVWERLESYIEEHADVEFSHGLCDECLAKTCAAEREEA